MNYLKIYNAMINDAIEHPKPDQYKENHHILPKCMGGLNDRSNLVRLTAKQHFLAHWLLFKIYGGSKLANAWYSMCRVGVGQDSRLINSRLFTTARLQRNKILSESSRGAGNHFYGKKHTIETKHILSEKSKARGKVWTEEGKQNWISKVATQPNSSRQREIAASQFRGKHVLQNIHTLEIRRVSIEDQVNYDPEIWMHPRKITPEKRNICPHCNIITTNANLKRWHYNKCKEFKCE